MITIREKVQLVSYDRVVCEVVNRITTFANEAEMHKHCARIAFALERKGLAFNGHNARRHYVYLTKEL